MSRYARQEILPEVGPRGQARLAGAHVLVVGAGGLGSTVLPLLAGAGVGRIAVVDPDRVEESNLHRQVLFRQRDLGAAKAERAARSLSRLNLECHVTGHVARLDPANAPAFAEGVDLVIDAADSFAVSYALSDHCRAAGLPLITASVLGRAGYVAGVCGGAPSLRALFPDLPMTAQTCASGGVMGPAVAAIGALQAQMALSVLLGHAPSPLGQVMQLDLATWRSSGFRFDGAPEAPGPAVIAPCQIAPDDHVIDLRLTPDYPAPRPAPEERVVFACNTGLRAWRAARRVMEGGHARVAVIGYGS